MIVALIATANAAGLDPLVALSGENNVGVVILNSNHHATPATAVAATTVIVAIVGQSRGAARRRSSRCAARACLPTGSGCHPSIGIGTYRAVMLARESHAFGWRFLSVRQGSASAPRPGIATI